MSVVAEGVKTGKVVQVIGPVDDIELAGRELPEIYNAVRITGHVTGQSRSERRGAEGSPQASGASRGAGVPDDQMIDIVVEVEQHLGENRVRTVAMKPTDGLQRGMTASDLGGPISMPVGPGTLGRVLNVLGEPVDFPDRPVVYTER